MKISVLHPSRGRAQRAYETYCKWVNNADDPFEYIMAWDEDDYRQYYEQFFYEDHNIEICLRPNHSAIEAINNAAKIATGDLFVVISDDTDTFQGWDTALLNELQGKEDFLVKCQDGIQPKLITMPVMDRKYYERFGYIYFGGYSHMYADNELTEVGHILGRVITSNLIFEHLHYLTGKNKIDAIYEKNNTTYQQGLELFNKRKSINFDL